MTQEDRKLLLTDLCARLPYGVIGEYSWKGNELHDRELTGNLYNELNFSWNSTEDSKFTPYFRPISSMTDEEEREYNEALKPLGDFMFEQEELFKPIQLYKNIPFELYEFFNSHHFDYRGLIEKGLAIEAPEGMYNKH